MGVPWTWLCLEPLTKSVWPSLHFSLQVCLYLTILSGTHSISKFLSNVSGAKFWHFWHIGKSSISRDQLNVPVSPLVTSLWQTFRVIISPVSSPKIVKGLFNDYKKVSDQPDSNQWPRDNCLASTVSRSANWAIVGCWKIAKRNIWNHWFFPNPENSVKTIVGGQDH